MVLWLNFCIVSPEAARCVAFHGRPPVLVCNLHIMAALMLLDCSMYKDYKVKDIVGSPDLSTLLCLLGG